MSLSPTARTALRTAFAAALAGLGAVRGALGDGTFTVEEIVEVTQVVLLAAGAWLGIGAVTPLEPFLGKRKEPLEVPSDAVVVRQPPQDA